LGAAITKVTEEEYLRLERPAEYKSEFIDGEIFARSSCSPKHVLLATNWGAELVIQLRGRRCGVFNSDLRIREHVGNESTLVLSSINCTIKLKDVYSDPCE
jgi:Uma2 family endonuclease